MNRKDVLNLMQFVIDQNSIILAEAARDLQINDQQTRVVMNAIESKTKDCFLRFVDKMPATNNKTKRNKK